MLKKAALAALILLSMLFLALPASASEPITVYIDGQKLATDAPPLVINGTTFVPMRAVFGAFGKEVEWYENTQTIRCGTGSAGITLTIGSRYAIKYGNEVELGEAPRTINGRTMVPLRFIAETFYAKVEYDAAANCVYITKSTVLQDLIDDVCIRPEVALVLLPQGCCTYLTVSVQNVQSFNYTLYYDLEDEKTLKCAWSTVDTLDDDSTKLRIDALQTGSAVIELTVVDQADSTLLATYNVPVTVLPAPKPTECYSGFSPVPDFGQLCGIAYDDHYYGIGEDRGLEEYCYDSTAWSVELFKDRMDQYYFALIKAGFELIDMQVNAMSSKYYYYNKTKNINVTVAFLIYEDGSDNILISIRR
ncbi:MAG: copper amine oxidase N-terminal domain-containing protein [Clostridia bacterium]|nr:copper amine oxidase N-terminal domain-containing protein [Clostridia bacterium]